MGITTTELTESVVDEAQRTDTKREAREATRGAYLIEHFDADGDGVISDEGLAAHEDEVRGRIRRGEQPHPEPKEASISSLILFFC